MIFLVAAYTGLGNLILRIPFFKKIKELYPNSRIDIITGNVSALTPFIPAITAVHQLDMTAPQREKFLFFRRLKKIKYDTIFIPFDSRPRFLKLYSYCTAIPLRVMHQEFGGPSYCTNLKYAARMCLYPKSLFVPFLPGRHEIDLNLDLLEAYHNAESYPNTPLKRSYDTPLHLPNHVQTLHN
ncbi:MAG: hypothetical protein WB791_01745 [Waddliaceae bacterium]